jgi:S-adenosylmethionine synthetase
MKIRTAEVVSPSHPDKLCDRVSDALVDAYLQADPDSRCAIETAGGHGKIYITGEVTSKYKMTDSSIKEIVSNITNVRDILINIVEQSPEIAQGVNTGGAGDQGIMIGYACNENEDKVPQEYYLARKLNRLIYEKYSFDGKTQVTIEGKKVRAVASFQNAPKEDLEKITKAFFKKENYTIESLHCNPAGDWKQGGFDADAGVTGRKLAVDNYGPRVPIGGGAFSGKDATKVDRSAAYMARRIAVDYLDKFKADEVQVTLAYAIGYDQPLQATASVDGVDKKITGYDLSPQGIIEFLDLKKPNFYETSKWGHMGNNFNWK